MSKNVFSKKDAFAQYLLCLGTVLLKFYCRVIFGKLLVENEQKLLLVSAHPKISQKEEDGVLERNKTICQIFVQSLIVIFLKLWPTGIQIKTCYKRL